MRYSSRGFLLTNAFFLLSTADVKVAFNLEEEKRNLESRSSSSVEGARNNTEPSKHHRQKREVYAVKFDFYKDGENYRIPYVIESELTAAGE